MNEASFAHDGWFEAECFWCGIPAAVGEKVEIIQYSRREAYWMHPNCARLLSTTRRKNTLGITESLLKYHPRFAHAAVAKQQVHGQSPATFKF